jgi:hypothetical protein
MCEDDQIPDSNDEDEDEDPLMDALRLAEETEAVAALLAYFAEEHPIPRVRSTAKALQRSAHQLIVVISELMDPAD